ncbi:hypothetical protein [Streptomyces sp. NPDC059928]|uniref:hypothetical protein n=1 Tax=unclassified Streptomyces TaxID=2593676 RepID=UPI003657E53D
MNGDLIELRHAEADDGSAGCFGVELRQLALRPGKADLQALDLAEPAFPFGLSDAGQEVVADVGEPCPLGRIRPKE